MPFKESCRMEERMALLRAYDSGAFSVTELCARFGVSRETFYVWKDRRERGEERWFEDKSHAPLVCPHATGKDRVEAITALRRRFPRFGPKKIHARLIMEQPTIVWPAASTIGDILKREGLIEARRRRRRPIAQGEADVCAFESNDEWAMDFKGWFRTLDGRRIDPLTISDRISRYLIAVRITPPTHDGVKDVLIKVFNEFGLPSAIRSDNGSPFGSSGAGGLSRLSVWLLKLGIEPLYIPPASPQDNGRHERMHRTLKAETAKPPAHTPAQQQERFDGFRQMFNEDRPHEALGQTTPASHWRASRRSMPLRISEPGYDPDHQVRCVGTDGTIKWRGEHIFIGEAFAGEAIGLREQEHGGHLVRFLHRDLGLLDAQSRFHRFAPPRARLRSTAKSAKSTSE